jgi:LacI family transcriptional regulator
MTATMKEVAERAGVSVITVSRVVNEIGCVRAETRARVRAAIEELGYIPNQVASSLRSRRTRSIALMLPTIANSFWTTIARGVEDEAEARGYSVFLCNTDDDQAKERRYFEVLLRNRVDGVAIVPSYGSSPYLETLQQRQMPLVQIHRKLDGVQADVVRADSYGGTFALTESLVAAAARCIAYIGGPLLSPGRDRLAGYRDAIARAGMTDDSALIRTGDADPGTGYRLVRELMSTANGFDAVVIANSRMAVGAIHALAVLGRRIPDDVAIGAYHDIATPDTYSSPLDAYSPYITTATQPAYDMGRLSVRRLFERIGGTTDPIEEFLLPIRIMLPTLAVPGHPPSERSGTASLVQPEAPTVAAVQ